MNAKRAFASCAAAFICMLMPFSAFADFDENTNTYISYT